MPLDTPALLKRIDQLLAVSQPDDGPVGHATIVEVMQGTVTLARALYGDQTETPQLQTIIKAAQKAREAGVSNTAYIHLLIVWPVVQGSLRAMRAEIEAGLVGSIERRATGEVIADMLLLAKEALRERSDGAKNVAAVLTAAAYEDTVRKMGATLAAVTGRPELSEVLTSLKIANVLVGAPLTTALGYLKFRNDALHADWEKLDAAVVSSCLAFVEGLVLQHLS
ncbi:MAG: hypothetical protein A3H95_12635 [Acidobacteria bacterium RIFCSPLOWO2_02_FULL_64_15]|nr:MAG: hypothetical protein A3H95_12635 [Acidobacteria bacterium RIFCSPLOWO2_02_FULL_64_15]